MPVGCLLYFTEQCKIFQNLIIPKIKHFTNANPLSLSRSKHKHRGMECSLNPKPKLQQTNQTPPTSLPESASLHNQLSLNNHFPKYVDRQLLSYTGNNFPNRQIQPKGGKRSSCQQPCLKFPRSSNAQNATPTPTSPKMESGRIVLLVSLITNTSSPRNHG